MSRVERLKKDDFYDEAKPQNRPSTKSKGDSGALYVENTDVPP